MDVFILLITLLIFIIAALPLYFAVKLLGGRVSMLLAVGVMILSGLLAAVINFFFPVWGWIITFLILVWVYHEAFRLKWWKACLVWVVEIIIVALLVLIVSLLGLVLLL